VPLHSLQLFFLKKIVIWYGKELPEAQIFCSVAVVLRKLMLEAKILLFVYYFAATNKKERHIINNYNPFKPLLKI
jgi:hypothetical protein